MGASEDWVAAMGRLAAAGWRVMDLPAVPGGGAEIILRRDAVEIRVSYPQGDRHPGSRERATRAADAAAGAFG